jgi:hypothetical protein
VRDEGRHPVLGIGISAIDYEAAVGRIVEAARSRRHLGVSALAVHGVMTGVDDPEQRYRLNALDLVVPDGQPVRWALNLLHRTGLTDRVYGPELTLAVCEAAAREGLPIFLYGSRPEVLEALATNLGERYPGLVIAGRRPSLFRPAADDDEQRRIAAEIAASDAAICLVGLGCPRQETFVFEHRDLLPMPMLAVGAAFDFHAGVLAQAPAWMQARGLEWLFRLGHEPRRLWRRYLVLNPRYAWRVLLQRLGRYPLDAGTEPAAPARPA